MDSYKEFTTYETCVKVIFQNKYETCAFSTVFFIPAIVTSKGTLKYIIFVIFSWIFTAISHRMM